RQQSICTNYSSQDLRSGKPYLVDSFEMCLFDGSAFDGSHRQRSQRSTTFFSGPPPVCRRTHCLSQLQPIDRTHHGDVRPFHGGRKTFAPRTMPSTSTSDSPYLSGDVTNL